MMGNSRSFLPRRTHRGNPLAYSPEREPEPLAELKRRTPDAQNNVIAIRNNGRCRRSTKDDDIKPEWYYRDDCARGSGKDTEDGNGTALHINMNMAPRSILVKQ